MRSKNSSHSQMFWLRNIRMHKFLGWHTLRLLYDVLRYLRFPSILFFEDILIFVLSIKAAGKTRVERVGAEPKIFRPSHDSQKFSHAFVFKVLGCFGKVTRWGSVHSGRVQTFKTIRNEFPDNIFEQKKFILFFSRISMVS